MKVSSCAKSSSAKRDECALLSILTMTLSCRLASRSISVGTKSGGAAAEKTVTIALLLPQLAIQPSTSGLISITRELASRTCPQKKNGRGLKLRKRLADKRAREKDA